MKHKWLAGLLVIAMLRAMGGCSGTEDSSASQKAEESSIGESSAAEESSDAEESQNEDSSDAEKATTLLTNQRYCSRTAPSESPTPALTKKAGWAKG